jgi:hypothetical protein
MTVQVLDIKKQNTPPTSCVITVGYETYLCRTPNPPTLEGGRGYPLSPFGGGGLGVIENGRTGWSE